MVADPAAEAARVARDAEAAARREERDKRKAEDDARRAEEQAAREARKKDDAERSAALTSALTAMLEDMEKVATESHKDTRTIDRLLQQAAKAFDQIGKVAGDQRDALADRYTTARGKLVVKASELREAQDWQRFQNVPKAEALIAAAKEMLLEEPSADLGNRLRLMQGFWKDVGPMPQRRSKELWEQFKSLCDQIYDKIKGFRAVESEKFGEVAKAKEALIAEAEALADSTDFAATAAKMKELQAQWKASGHVPRKQGDELWNRFRAACDKFFERRKPELDAKHAEEGKNLAAKQQLIAKAQSVAAGAPGEGGWGKAIAEIKKLQQQWKEIGFVPRRDADAVYKAFRAACDSLFAKRDEARDAEANAHREAIDDVKADIADILVGGDDIVTRALAIRTKAEELDSRELSRSVDQMMRHVITSNPDAVKGTELDPQAARNRRDKLIAKAEELLPKTPAAPGGGDIAAQLKNAMRSNAFGDLRFSGRDPVEVVDDLRQSWANAGPILDDEDRDQVVHFDDVIKRVLDAAGAAGAAARAPSRDEAGEGEGRRRRRDRDGRRDDRRDDRRRADAPISAMPPVGSPSSDAAATTAAVVSAAAFGAPAAAATLTEPPMATSPAPVAAPPVVAPPKTVPSVAAIPQTAHDAITAPAKIPFDAIPAPAVPAPSPFAAKAEPALPPVSTQVTPVVEPPRAKPVTVAPAMDALDDAWDMPDDDPTASASADQAAAADAAMPRPEPEVPPSSSEMAGDGAAAGDGIDEPGWD